MSWLPHVLATLFSWPNGIVLGNLLASLIWAVPGLIHLDRLARRHHREHMALLRRGHRPAASPPPGPTSPPPIPPG